MQQEEITSAPNKAGRGQLTDEQRKLVDDHIGIVYSFLKDHNVIYREENENHRDLKSDMNEALCHAALTYDKEKNAKFTTYAWTCLENAWINRIKSQNRQKRIPEDKLYSLNEPVYYGEDGIDNEDKEYGDLLTSNDNTEEEALCNLIFDECVKALNERELLVLQLYMQGNTVETISKKLKCTDSYIYKIIAKFVKRFKSASC